MALCVSLISSTISKWSLRSLESCERTKADVLRLHFDTVRRDKKERVYRVEPGLCQQLEKYLRSILSQRPLSEMNQTLYRCVKCSSKFSREKKGPQALKWAQSEINCPNCQCNFVVEIVEVSATSSSAAAPSVLPAVAPPSNVVAALPGEVGDSDRGGLEASGSHSSIGKRTEHNPLWSQSSRMSDDY